MNYYQEITLLPDAEIPLGFIWQNVFQQVHIALVENKVAENESLIGVAFPLYKKRKFPLGDKLRLFSQDQSQLEQLDINKWLGRLLDYVHVKTIQPVPDDVSYVTYSRKHVKSPSRIELDMFKKAKRLSEKTNKPYDECVSELEKTKPEPKRDIPFVILHSQETKKRTPEKNSKFPLYIQMEPAETAQKGAFDCYGLNAKANSKDDQATVPHF